MRSNKRYLLLNETALELYGHFMKCFICLFQGQKEMKSLQLMIHTYRENPKFGDVKKFEEELEVAVCRVQQLQSTLHSLRSQLDDVNLSLDNLKVGHVGQHSVCKTKKR